MAWDDRRNDFAALLHQFDKVMAARSIVGHLPDNGDVIQRPEAVYADINSPR